MDKEFFSTSEVAKLLGVSRITVMLYFLYRNKKWLRVDNQELYNFAKWVAESNPKLRKETVRATEKFIKTYVVGYGK